MRLIEKNIGNILKMRELCDKYNVLTLYVFGSVTTNRFQENSDIDLLVRFNSIKNDNYADNYFDFKYSLEDLYHRKIDMLEEQAIKNPYLLESINKSKELVYG